MPSIKKAIATSVPTTGVVPHMCITIGHSIDLKINSKVKPIHHPIDPKTAVNRKTRPKILSPIFTIPPIISTKKSKKFFLFFFLSFLQPLHNLHFLHVR